MNISKPQIEIRFTKWAENHIGDYRGDNFWHAQNAVGDVLGWPEWYWKFISKLINENDLSKKKGEKK